MPDAGAVACKGRTAIRCVSCGIRVYSRWVHESSSEQAQGSHHATQRTLRVLLPVEMDTLSAEALRD